jgi:hypothetical protein
MIDGEDAYDEATNTIRIRHPNGKTMYTLLASTGIFMKPDYNKHMVIHFHNWEIKTINDNTVVPGLGLLIQTAEYENWTMKSGAGVSYQSSTATGTAAEGEEIVIKGQGGEFPTGISWNKENGTMIIRGAGGGEIAINDEVFIKGKVHFENPSTRNNLLRDNPMRQFCFPSFCVFPLPSEIPQGTIFRNLASILGDANEISGLVRSLS